MTNDLAHEIRDAIAKLPTGIEAGRTSPTVKLFTPDGNATWYIIDRMDGELVFGYCDLGLGFPELGYVSVTELESVRGRFGLPIEVDLYWNGTLADAYQAQEGGVPEWLPEDPSPREEA